MPDERVIQQVSGILGMSDISFKTGEDKQSFLVPYGSAGVIVSFVDRGESTVVSLRAVLLQEVDGSGERRLKILEALNEKNQRSLFGCFYFEPDDGLVIVDYHLLGDQLQAPELLSALGALCASSDEADDELREAIGSGRVATDVWNAAEADASDPVGVGPVVET